MMSESRHIRHSVASRFVPGSTSLWPRASTLGGQCCVSDYNAAKRHARKCRVPCEARAPQLRSLLYSLMLAARRGDGDWVECCRSALTR